MLAIRLQRTGRTGHAQFRLVVQDARLNPSSGKVVAQLGNYNPHTKIVTVDKEKAGFYLEHGARPSERVVLLLKKEGLKMPKWVTGATKKEGQIRKPEKLRKNRPAGTEAPLAEPAVSEKSAVLTPDVLAEEPGTAAAAETSAEEVKTTKATAEAEPAEELSQNQPAEQKSES